MRWEMDLTMDYQKTYSNQYHINICYYWMFQIPIMYRELFRMLSQNPEYLKSICHDLKYPFHFACRKWYLYISDSN